MSAVNKHSEAAEAAWAHRKTWNETWARADTERWLDERSHDVAAWVRDRGVKLRVRFEPKFMGAWLRSKLIGNFNAAHAKLAKMTVEARIDAAPKDILPDSARSAIDSEPPFEKRA